VDAHKCHGWQYILPEIKKYTRNALFEHGLLPVFNPGDVVVQQRCAPDTILSHPEFGPIGYSFYDEIKNDTLRVLIVSNHVEAENSSICKRLNESLWQHLRKILPNAHIEYSAGNAFEDFANLVYAPVLFKEQGSFGLWSAAANTGEVHSAPLWHDDAPHAFKIDAPNWHWTTARVLYPSVARADGISTPDDVVHWVQTH